ncbi:response regulator [Kordiimonas sp.]|uniref:response regulator n=1 Tax=Kordiimonas sp. TaxID=1970157 RepID=UPI003A8E5964
MAQTAQQDIPESAEATGPHILVVEDNPVMASILSKLLGRFEARFDVVANGLEAIDAAKEAEYDLIFMDILMPTLGGVRSTKAIRKLSAHYENIPIIAVTARVSERAEEEYLSEGMSGMIKKPINRVNLSEALRDHLGLEEHIPTPATDDTSAVHDTDDLDALNWEVFNEYRTLLSGSFMGFLKDYLTAGPNMLSDIGDAITADDAPRIQFLAHKLKSTAQVFGAESVADLAAQLEIMGKNNATAPAPQIFHELHIAYERTQRALRKKYILMQNMG